MGAVRVAGSRTGETRAIRPMNVSPGNASDLDAGDVARLQLLQILLDDVGDQTNARDVDDFDDGAFWPTEAPGSTSRLEMNPLTGDVMIVLREIDLEFVEPGLRLLRLRAGQIDLTPAPTDNATRYRRAPASAISFLSKRLCPIEVRLLASARSASR